MFSSVKALLSTKKTAHNPLLRFSLVPFFGAKERNVKNITLCRNKPSVEKQKSNPSIDYRLLTTQIEFCIMKKNTYRGAP